MTFSRYVIGLLFLLLVCACSNMPGPGLIAPGDTVVFETSSGGHDGESVPIRNKAIETDSQVGVTSGALVGAAWGITCGPWFWICSPVGALMGAVGGGATGFVVGAAEGLGKEKGLLLTSEISSALRSYDVQQQLIETVSNRARAHWQVIETTADKRIVIQLDHMGLETLRKEQAELVMEVSVTVNALASLKKDHNQTRHFAYRSSPTYINSWIENHDDFIKLRFMDAHRTLAENIIMELSVR